MLKKILSILFKDFSLFSLSYSNNIFPEPLETDDEQKYIELMLSGDKDARNILIEHNLRLVAHIVKKYDTNKEDIDDLISIGTIGLIKGIDSYKTNKGIKLTTYVARCIENEILMFYRGDKKNSKNISINESIGFDKEGNEISLLDILKTPKPDYALDIHKKDNIKLMKTYFKYLTKREKEILIKRYGLDDKDELTQKEIAKELGISRSYVSRIEKRAITKILREFIKNKKES
ncbi:MAG: RNA polymerase sporulation sigma factor SigK [Bacilli bacterium]|nr:RNA polymerase sporulation sigma factor SigK [Bacilli bacterium]